MAKIQIDIELPEPLDFRKFPVLNDYYERNNQSKNNVYATLAYKFAEMFGDFERPNKRYRYFCLVYGWRICPVSTDELFPHEIPLYHWLRHKKGCSEFDAISHTWHFDGSKRKYKEWKKWTKSKE